MRQIAEFVAVLSCSLFTGAAVYINLVERPARMESGVEIAATEFAPSYRRATIMQASLAALGILSSIAAWLAGATFWWLVAGALSGQRYPVHAVRDPANEQSIAEPHAGHTISRNGAATRPLGEIACRETRAERRGASAVPVLGDLQGASVRSCSLDRVREAASVLHDHAHFLATETRILDRHAEEGVFVLLVIGSKGVLVEQHQFRINRARFRKIGKLPSDSGDQAGLSLHSFVIGHGAMRIAAPDPVRVPRAGSTARHHSPRG
jgi:hypothetical protein